MDASNCCPSVASDQSSDLLVIADYERDMPGIEHGPLGWHTSALTTELQEVRHKEFHGIPAL